MPKILFQKLFQKKIFFRENKGLKIFFFYLFTWQHVFHDGKSRKKTFQRKNLKKNFFQKLKKKFYKKNVFRKFFRKKRFLKNIFFYFLKMFFLKMFQKMFFLNISYIVLKTFSNTFQILTQKCFPKNSPQNFSQKKVF